MVSNVVITLLRHGRTLDNEASRYSGWIDSQLSKTGINEIKAMTKYYQKENTFSADINRIYTSDLKRTIQTAQLLFPGNFSIKQDKKLREMHFGDFEGKTYDELKENPHYQTWLNHLFTYQLPNGESFNQFTNRIDKGLAQIKSEILKEELSHVVLVVHGGVIRYLLTKLTNHSHSFFEWEVPFARGFQLTSTHTEFKEENPCMSLRVVPSMENGIL